MHLVHAGADFRQHRLRIEPHRDRLQRLGDHPGGDLARLMPAGAVGDRPDAEVGTIDEAIFVVAAPRPGMGGMAGA